MLSSSYSSEIISLKNRIAALEEELQKDHILAGSMLRGILLRLEKLEGSHISTEEKERRHITEEKRKSDEDRIVFAGDSC